MSDLYNDTLQPAICAYRARSDRITSNMNGVRRFPGRQKCVCCEKMRTEETGRWLPSGKFLCHHCGKVPK